VLSNKEKEAEKLGWSNLVDTENLLNLLLSGEDKKRDKEKKGKKIKLEELNRNENVKRSVKQRRENLEKIVQKVDNEDFLEDIFIIGYGCAVKITWIKIKRVYRNNKRFVDFGLTVFIHFSFFL
jgi:hypothetical protein